MTTWKLYVQRDGQWKPIGTVRRVTEEAALTVADRAVSGFGKVKAEPEPDRTLITPAGERIRFMGDAADFLLSRAFRVLLERKVQRPHASSLLAFALLGVLWLVSR